MEPLPLRPLCAALLACTLAACHMPDTIMEEGAIRLYGDELTLHVDGTPEADIAADGSFTIDGKAVTSAPAERGLMAQYNHSVRAVHDTGVAGGKAGIEKAAKGTAATASSTPDKADVAASADAGKLQDLTLGICKDTAAIKVAQDQLAAQLAAFKPYAYIVGTGDVANCLKDAKD